MDAKTDAQTYIPTMATLKIRSAYMLHPRAAGSVIPATSTLELAQCFNENRPAAIRALDDRPFRVDGAN